MKHITSTQNPNFKRLKRLASSSKARRESGHTLLEGAHLATSYLETGQVPLECIVSQSAITYPEAAAIVSRCEQAAVPILVVSDQHFKQLSGVEHGLGLLFVISQPASRASGALDRSALLIDSVQDPGNVGTMLRTAAAANIGAIYCSPGSASAWSPRVLRAGMGAQFHLEIYEEVDLATIIESTAVPVYATTLDASQSLYDTNLSGPAAWIVGNEGQGVSPNLLTSHVTQVIIPQKDTVESLNVAAATAVCLFEHYRQNLS